MNRWAHFPASLLVHRFATLVAATAVAVTTPLFLAVPAAATPTGDTAYGLNFAGPQVVGSGGIASDASATFAALSNRLTFFKAEDSGSSLKFTLAFQAPIAPAAGETYNIGVRLTAPDPPAIDLRGDLGSTVGPTQQSFDGGKTWTVQPGATVSALQSGNAQPTITFNPMKFNDGPQWGQYLTGHGKTTMQWQPATSVQAWFAVHKGDGSGFTTLSNPYPLGSLTGQVAPNTLNFSPTGSVFTAAGLSSQTCTETPVPTLQFNPTATAATMIFRGALPQSATINVGGADSYENVYSGWQTVTATLRKGAVTDFSLQDHRGYPPILTQLPAGAVSVSGSSITFQLIDGKAMPLLSSGAAATANLAVPIAGGVGECLYQAVMVPLPSLRAQKEAPAASAKAPAAPAATGNPKPGGLSTLAIALGGGVLALVALAGGGFLLIRARRPSSLQQEALNRIDRLGIDDLKARIQYLEREAKDVDDDEDLSETRSASDVGEELLKARSRLKELGDTFDPNPAPEDRVPLE